MVITFAGALLQALAYYVHFNAASRTHVVSTNTFFSSLIDGCLKYKEKLKTGPRPGPARV